MTAVNEERAEKFFEEIEIPFLIHELKDPIAIIETGVRTLLEKQERFGSLTSKQENTLKRALRNTKKARAMLSNILEIGRSESGCFVCCRFQPEKSVFQALKDALETSLTGPITDEIGKYESKDEAASLLSGNGIFVATASDVSRIEMFQDEIKFRQIAGNLFKNAIHHRSQRVDIRLEIIHDCLSLSVSDDGPGIDPDQHELVFRRYAQTKECSIVPRKGHGLGLAGARILAKCLGGDIALDSKTGEGATFRLTIPLEMRQTQF